MASGTGLVCFIQWELSHDSIYDYDYGQGAKNSTHYVFLSCCPGREVLSYECHFCMYVHEKLSKGCISIRIVGFWIQLGLPLTGTNTPPTILRA